MVMWKLIDASIHDVDIQDHKNVKQWHSKLSDNRQLVAEIIYMSNDIWPPQRQIMMINGKSREAIKSTIPSFINKRRIDGKWVRILAMVGEQEIFFFFFSL